MQHPGVFIAASTSDTANCRSREAAGKLQCHSKIARTPCMRKSSNPPTIAKLKSMGVAGIDVACRDCLRSTSLPFDLIALLDETLFPDIVKLRRFRCEGCGSKRAVVTPDWRGMKAPGMGG